MNTGLLKTPLRYPGGKSKAIKKIFPFFPKSFNEYREPFLGGGSIFLTVKNKYPEVQCQINDLNYDLYCFWVSLKDNSEEFISEILKIKNNTQNGKELYLKMKNTNYETIFEKGLRYYILNRISYSGTVDSGGYSKEAFEKRFTFSKIYQLNEISTSLQDVNITSEDYTRFLQGGGKDTFVYLDPPYLSAVKSKLYGRQGDLHKSFNHLEFSQKMRDCNFKWLITLDDTKEIRKMFSFATINSLDLIYGMDKANGKKHKKGKELLITNYDYSLMNNISLYRNILDRFIKIKSNKAYVEIDISLKMVKQKLEEIVNNDDSYRDITIHIKNNKLYIKR